MKVFMMTSSQTGVDRTEIKDANVMGISLVLDDGQEFIVKDGGGGLRVAAYNGRLVVEPEASNVIQVSELRE